MSQQIKIKGFDTMMNVNVKFEEKTVKKIDTNTDFLPKLGLAKKRTDRNGIIAGLKAGNRYVVPFTVTFSDWSTWSSKFAIVKMFKQDKTDIIIVEEESLGQFGIYFNSLANGSFKKEMEKAYNTMVRNKNTYYAELEKTQKDLENQTYQTNVARKGNVERDIKISVLESEKGLLKVDLDNAQYALQVRETQALTATEQIEMIMDDEKLTEQMMDLVKVMRLLNSKGANIVEIARTLTQLWKASFVEELDNVKETLK